jgi:8-amino-7-oxononanoate synthase
MAHLRTLLSQHRAHFRYAIIVTESVFSMDGTCVALDDICKLKQEFNTLLMVDDAHGVGILGPQFEGGVPANYAKEVDFCLGTFGKAFGTFGAFVACSSLLKQALIQKCRSWIYSTALPPAVIEATLASLNVIQTGHYQPHLSQAVSFLKSELVFHQIPFLGNSHIVPIVIGKSQVAVTVSKEMEQKGFWVQAVRSPTVPEHQARLRLSINATHTPAMIQKLIRALQQTLSSL